jgi:hypothetical protein
MWIFEVFLSSRVRLGSGLLKRHAGCGVRIIARIGKASSGERHDLDDVLRIQTQLVVVVAVS